MDKMWQNVFIQRNVENGNKRKMFNEKRKTGIRIEEINDIIKGKPRTLPLPEPPLD